ncbi:MAG: hypothetical protein PHR82_02560 [Endomicrobiaceae bacterium]|nr:hypothetical protein [Endomicrobiaceae bacterium]
MYFKEKIFRADKNGKMQTFNNKVILSVISCFLAVVNLYPQGARKNFLSHGPSVSSFAQGETVLNNNDDPAIIFYNSSLLSFFNYNSVSLGRYNLFDGTSYNSVSVSLNLTDNFNLGLSVINLSSGDVEIRQDPFDVPRNIQTNQWAYILASSYLINPINTALGVNLKYIIMDLYEKKDAGSAFDVSLSKFINNIDMFSTQTTIGFGLSAQNIVGTGVKLDTYREDFQKIFVLSSMIKIPVKFRLESKDTVALSLDARNEDSNTELFTGLEYCISDKYALRVGYYCEHITAGFGVDIANLVVNYSADFNEIDLINRFSLSYKWMQRKIYKVNDGLDIEAKNVIEEDKISRIEAEKMFAKAKKFYSNGQYLYATENLQKLIVKYPNHESSMFFYQKIKKKMKEDSVSMLVSDFSSYTYASGYVNYYEGDYYQCAKEWMKYLQFDKENKEISERLKQVNNILANELLKQQKIAFEKQANEFLQTGIDKFNKKQWIACIKQMEKLQTFVQSSKFTTSFNFYEIAKDYIDKSVAELMATVQKIKCETSGQESVQTQSAEIQEIDEKTADVKYREGLSLYANGKHVEAERMWELTLRLNPNHTRAINALNRLRNQSKL